MSIYVDNGYKGRKDYLKHLADENDVDYNVIEMLADLLGENEDFDGLISSIEDINT